MKNIHYKPQGTCSRAINIVLNDDNTIGDISIEGGCSGNLQGLSHLLKGMSAAEAVQKLEGIRCGMKATSCPDQIAKALKSSI